MGPGYRIASVHCSPRWHIHRRWLQHSQQQILLPPSTSKQRKASPRGSSSSNDVRQHIFRRWAVRLRVDIGPQDQLLAISHRYWNVRPWLLHHLPSVIELLGRHLSQIRRQCNCGKHLPAELFRGSVPHVHQSNVSQHGRRLGYHRLCMLGRPGDSGAVLFLLLRAEYTRKRFLEPRKRYVK